MLCAATPLLPPFQSFSDAKIGKSLGRGFQNRPTPDGGCLKNLQIGILKFKLYPDETTLCSGFLPFTAYHSFPIFRGERVVSSGRKQSEHSVVWCLRNSHPGSSRIFPGTSRCWPHRQRKGLLHFSHASTASPQETEAQFDARPAMALDHWRAQLHFPEDRWVAHFTDFGSPNPNKFKLPIATENFHLLV